MCGDIFLKLGFWGALLQTCNSATPIILDFGSVSSPNFGITESEIRYTNVATGINATLTVDSNFDAQTPANHGSVTGTHPDAEGDVRINMTSAIANTDPNNIANSGVFTLTLWDANAGDGFSTGYTSATSYEWGLNIYDIDAGDPGDNGFFTYDYFRVMTPGTYTVMANTNLVIDTTHADNSVSFSGINAGAVAGQDGLGPGLTPAQKRSSVQYTLTDRNVLTFEYAALRTGGNNLGSGRNLLVDGGELRDLFGNSATETFTVVPEPSWAPLLSLSCLVLLFGRKRA